MACGRARMPGAPSRELLGFDRLDHHKLAHRALVEKLDTSGDLGEQGVILAPADVEPGLHPRAALPHDNGAARYKLPAERFEPQPLRVGVAPISRCSLSFFMRHKNQFSVASSQFSVPRFMWGQPPSAVQAGKSSPERLLLFRRALLPSRLLLRSLGWRRLRALRRLLHFLFFLRQLRSLERLPVKSDLGDAHCREILPVPAQFLVLLLALVVEDEDFLAPALIDHFARHVRSRPRHHHAPGLSRHRYYVRELHPAVCAAHLLDPDDISRRYLILLATRADHRVHRTSSKKNHVGTAAPGRPARHRLALFPNSCACCFPAAAYDRERAARTQNGPASTGKPI